jgi:hypothetical protein
VYKCRYGELVDTLRQMLGRVGLMMLAAGDSEVTKRGRALRHGDFSISHSMSRVDAAVAEFLGNKAQSLTALCHRIAPSSLAGHRPTAADMSCPPAISVVFY